LRRRGSEPLINLQKLPSDFGVISRSRQIGRIRMLGITVKTVGTDKEKDQMNSSNGRKW